MPEERREVVVTDRNGSRSVATIVAALIIAAAVVFAIWYFGFQGGAADEEAPGTDVTIDITIPDDDGDEPEEETPPADD